MMETVEEERDPGDPGQEPGQDQDPTREEVLQPTLQLGEVAAGATAETDPDQGESQDQESDTHVIDHDQDHKAGEGFKSNNSQ